MLSREQNDALTRVEGDAPMGELLRSWAWFPFAISSQLVVGEAPLRVRLLGVDYVAFRAPDGRIGFIDEACPHRGVSMALARNEGCMLRCIFHGWAVDVSGRVVEAPTHQGDTGAFLKGIRTRQYTVREQSGLVWVWLGEAPAADFPNLPFFGLPDDRVWMTVTKVDCNWLQGVEGSLDSAHVGTLHQSWIPRLAASVSGGATIGLALKAVAPRYEIARTPFGLSASAVRPMEDNSTYVRTTQYVAPFVNLVPGTGRNEGSIFIGVPVDDTHHLLFFGYFSESLVLDDSSPRVQALIGNDRLDPRNFAPFKGSREDNWGQDRAAMAAGHFTGFTDNLLEEDIVVQVSMGPIVDRTREHPSSSDVAVVQARMLLLRALRNHRDGLSPLAPNHGEWTAVDALPVDRVVAAGDDWRTVPAPVA
jgi:nitrite reductase/ring-hydroxylating ferredoxin subunit